jgi:hypothetical protein
VSYAENMRLVDPFYPELGKLNASSFARRLVTHLPDVFTAFGETLSARESDWRRILMRSQVLLLGKSVIPPIAAMIPLLGLAAIVLCGLILLLWRGAWMMVFIILGSVVLVWTTPWPAQFMRYLMPLTPFLSICAFVALSQIAKTFGNRTDWATTLGRVGLTGAVALTFGVAIFTSLSLFYFRAKKDALVIANNNSAPYRLFAHDSSWQDWEEAATWINTHASRNTIVATIEPHWLYLLTGRLSVLPPMESDPVCARRLLENVPVSFVIADNWKFPDMSRRYLLPALESDPEGWRVVHRIGETKIYGRAGAVGNDEGAN